MSDTEHSASPMSPCGSLYAVKCKLPFLVAQSPSFPSLSLTKDVFITCCALLPTKVPPFEHGWQRRRQRRNSIASLETHYRLYQRMRKPLCVSTFYLNITLLDNSPFLRSDPPKNSFWLHKIFLFFLTSLTKLISDIFFSVKRNQFIHLRRLM